MYMTHLLFTFKNINVRVRVKHFLDWNNIHFLDWNDIQQ